MGLKTDHWTDTVEERFWKYVDVRDENDDSCWEWAGTKLPNGYGVLAVGYVGKSPRSEYAHRLAYYFNIGDVPDGLYVCHHCDNRVCCNPHHLFEGTAKDNVHDCIIKGHYARLKINRMSERAQEIADLANQGLPINIIAKQTGLTSSTVRNFVKGKTFAPGSITSIDRKIFETTPRPTGHYCYNSKLTPDDVRFIREVYKNKSHPQYMTIFELANKYGVNFSLISRVGRGVDGRYREIPFEARKEQSNDQL